MNAVEQIDAIIANLQTAREDAVKFDAGKVGAPGQRVRAALQQTKVACDILRRRILATQKGE